MIRYIGYSALALFALITTALLISPPNNDLPSSTVKILVNDGHGSGVHIGDGLILTAAHVVSVGVPIIKLDDNSTHAASVMWLSSAYDLALIKTSAELNVAKLSCREPVVNEPVTSSGNPLSMEFITSTGTVVGKTKKLDRWESVFPVDTVIVSGMSGGPVFDAGGNIIGINVGVMTLRGAMTGIGVVVPSSVICEMLARR